MYIGRMFIKAEKMEGEMLRYTNVSKKLVGCMWSISWNECLSHKKANFCSFWYREVRIGMLGETSWMQWEWVT